MKSVMKIAMAQVPTFVGHFEYNYNKILENIDTATRNKADLLVFPELNLFGYWPSDLLENSDLVKTQLSYIDKIQKYIPDGLGVIIGAATLNPKKNGKYYFNSAIFLEKNKKPKFFHKELLPNYDVFDEARHFEKGQTKNNFFKFKNKKILITICEDIWAWGEELGGTTYKENPLKKLKKNKIDLIVNISASPFGMGKFKKRYNVVSKTAKLFRAPMIYVNQVTAQDELIFDGGSFCVDSKGKIQLIAPFFEEATVFFDLEKKLKNNISIPTENTHSLRKALVIGIRDFVEKNGFRKIHLGLSGGIDSAVVACLAVEALGEKRVVGVALPGPYSSPTSYDLALKLSKNLKTEFIDIDIRGVYNSIKEELETSLGLREFGIVHENIQSRIRGLLLMSYSNLKNSLLLATGNKDEFGVGYSTLYGDMCGGLAPIGDLLKEQVYAIARSYNEEQNLIPQEIIDRPPTAELKENQKDQDTLPPYSDLDEWIDGFVRNKKKPNSLEQKNIYQKYIRSEFKRWQAPPILKISERSFGSGRRYPITWFFK